ncbi:Hemerythrin domain protein [hydrothermal vent metagenome]|uniref:Hemerythrin domain protein n=1 Tax=hydrothermal vent metagenome TaxID=652676 RepID=A0A3B0WPF2_9ZZZZ
MSYIEWTDDFSTGIKVIDAQHKRIIHYINQLTDAQKFNEPELVGEVLLNLTDYTLSHFAFEESLMEDAQYDAISIHKKTHDSFRNKIISYQTRYHAGENISDELFQILNIWLINHIADDDNNYAPVVRKNIPNINTTDKDDWLKKKIRHFFSRSSG